MADSLSRLQSDCLTEMQSMQDDKGSSAVHFHGLNNMIAVRGGFDAFSETKTLQRVISWSVIWSDYFR